MAEDIIKKTREVLSRRTNTGEVTSMEYGKLPPQARELEEAVLGAMMIESDAFDQVMEILKDESFYVDAHQKIFNAMKMLYFESQPIDMLTVTEQLRKNSDLDAVGGPFYISQLTNKVGSAAHVKHHATIIAEKYIQRQLINSSSTIIKEAYEDSTDVFELLDKAEKNLFAISDNNLRKASEDIASLVSSELRGLDVRRNNSLDHLKGGPAGFKERDKATGGWQKSDLIIVAARPAMGKTAFTLALARNAALQHARAVAIFSLEMSNAQLVQRLISMETEIPADKIRKGTLEKFESQILTSSIDNLRNAKIFIDDTAAINVFDLRSKCRRLKHEHNIDFVIIDYLQLMSGSQDARGNREQEISQISRALKALAKELEIPVIALSQLSRAPETRGGDKRPILSDLRESGAIEQDADIVLFLYRPEYYGFFNNPESGEDQRGIAEVIIAKHRNGPVGTVRTRFVSSFAKFADLDDFSVSSTDGAEDKNLRYKKLPSKANESTDDEGGDFSAEKKHSDSDYGDDPPF